MSSVAERIGHMILAAIDADKLVLPTMPEMALRVREVSDDPEATIKQLGDVISNDAALTARIIKVSNSPMFRGTRDIENLNMALSRLGMQTTSNLATGLAMEQMFQATNDVVDRRMREVWSRSCEVAGICHVLCKHYTKLRPEQATLAGLMFQVGMLPILAFAEAHPALTRDEGVLNNVIDQIHPQIGGRILEAWDFPSEIRNVPQDCLAYTRSRPSPDYADVVTVAMLQSYADTPFVEGINFSTVKAFDRLGLDPDVDSAEAEDLSEEMEAAMAALNG